MDKGQSPKDVYYDIKDSEYHLTSEDYKEHFSEEKKDAKLNTSFNVLDISNNSSIRISDHNDDSIRNENLSNIKQQGSKSEEKRSYNKANIEFESNLPGLSNFTRDPLFAHQVTNPYPIYNQIYDVNTGTIIPLVPMIPSNFPQQPKYSLVSCSTNPVSSESIQFKANAKLSAKNQVNEKSIEINNKEQSEEQTDVDYILNNRDIISDLKNTALSNKLRQLLPMFNKEQVNKAFKAILNDITDLFIHPIANYFCQEIIVLLETTPIQRIWKRVFKNLEYLSCADYSTHCVQVLLEKTTSVKDQKVVISYFEPSFFNIAIHKRGYHVIKKLAELAKGTAQEKITDIILKNFTYLSKNIYGVNSIKKLISIFKDQPNHPLLDKMIENLSLSCNVYGNYVYLFLLEEWKAKYLIRLIEKIYLNIDFLSFDKYGSRVILKLLDIAPEVSL